MALPGRKQTLAKMSQTYLMLDVNCLFVAASLREEVWLYTGREDVDLLDRICRSAAEFGIRGVDPDRELVTYSGGEQAILACLLTLFLIQALDLSSRQLLLFGVWESISEDNRQRLGRFFREAARTHRAEAYCLRDNQVHEWPVEPCASLKAATR